MANLLTDDGGARRRALRRVVLTWLATARGGAERSVRDLANAAARMTGLPVDVVWWDYGDAYGPGAHEIEPGVSWHAVDNTLAYAQTLRDVIAADPRHTVVIGNHRTATTDVAVCDPVGVPVLVVMRALLVAEGQLRFIKRAHDPDLTPCKPADIDWRALSSAACWIGISRASAESVRRYAPPAVPVRTICNGLRLPHLPLWSKTRDSKRRLVVVSRIERWKRIDRVLSAYGRLPRDLALRARLDVYGEGPDLERLKLLASELSPAHEIRFHGYVADAIERLYRSDVLLSGSDWEGFGRVVVEAAAAGTPAVVPRSGAAAEIVIDELTGLTYDLAEVAEFTERIAEAISWNDRTLDQMGQAGRALAFALFTDDRCAADYVGLSTEILRQALSPCD